MLAVTALTLKCIRSLLAFPGDQYTKPLEVIGPSLDKLKTPWSAHLAFPVWVDVCIP